MDMWFGKAATMLDRIALTCSAAEQPDCQFSGVRSEPLGGTPTFRREARRRPESAALELPNSTSVLAMGLVSADAADDTSTPLAKGLYALDDFLPLHTPLRTSAFGRVTKVVHRKTRQLFVLKTLPMHAALPSNEKDHLDLDVEAQTMLHHPNILRLYECIRRDQEMHLILEYATGSTLSSVLKKHGRFDEPKGLSLWAPVSRAINFLHNRGIVCKAVAPKNVLVCDDGVVKIAGLGWSAGLRDDPGSTLSMTDYIAPEMVDGEPQDHFVDVWALGVLLYELLAGKPPFGWNTKGACLHGGWEVDMCYPEFMSTLACDLIQKLIVKDKQLRLPLEKALAHPLVLSSGLENGSGTELHGCGGSCRLLAVQEFGDRCGRSEFAEGAGRARRHSTSLSTPCDAKPVLDVSGRDSVMSTSSMSVLSDASSLCSIYAPAAAGRVQDEEEEVHGVRSSPVYAARPSNEEPYAREVCGVRSSPVSTMFPSKEERLARDVRCVPSSPATAKVPSKEEPFAREVWGVPSSPASTMLPSKEELFAGEVHGVPSSLASMMLPSREEPLAREVCGVRSSPASTMLPSKEEPLARDVRGVPSSPATAMLPSKEEPFAREVHGVQSSPASTMLPSKEELFAGEVRGVPSSLVSTMFPSKPEPLGREVRGVRSSPASTMLPSKEEPLAREVRCVQSSPTSMMLPSKEEPFAKEVWGVPSLPASTMLPRKGGSISSLLTTAEFGDFISTRGSDAGDTPSLAYHGFDDTCSARGSTQTDNLFSFSTQDFYHQKRGKAGAALAVECLCGSAFAPNSRFCCMCGRARATMADCAPLDVREPAQGVVEDAHTSQVAVSRGVDNGLDTRSSSTSPMRPGVDEGCSAEPASPALSCHSVDESYFEVLCTRSLQHQRAEALVDLDNDEFKGTRSMPLMSQCRSLARMSTKDFRKERDMAKAVAARCACGNLFLPDSSFCRRCGKPRPGAVDLAPPLEEEEDAPFLPPCAHQLNEVLDLGHGEGEAHSPEATTYEVPGPAACRLLRSGGQREEEAHDEEEGGELVVRKVKTDAMFEPEVRVLFDLIDVTMETPR